MSDKKVVDDGGYVYARAASEFTGNGTCADGNDPIEAQRGLTMREYFAGQALVGYRAHPADVSDKQIPWVAEYCVKIADALIAELKK